MGLRRALITLAAVSCCALLCSVLLATAVGGAFVYGARVKRTESERKLSQEWSTVGDRVEADEARWVDDPLFAPRDGGDASPVITPHIRWEHSDAGAPVPESLAAQLKSDSGWPHNISQLDVSRIDTDWLAQLGAYGFFDIEATGSPVEREPWRPSYEAIPNFIDLQTLAKVHLTKGLQRGDARAAARDVREIARLCLTTESLVGEMLGVAILGIERSAYEEARVRGHDVSQWQPLTEQEKQSLTRVLWAALAPYALRATGDLAARTPRVGQCTALREELGRAHEARQYSEAIVPERYASLTSALEFAPCRLRRPRVAWANKEIDGQYSCERGYDPEHLCWSPLAMHVPFINDVFGNVLVTVSSPAPFRRYLE